MGVALRVALLGLLWLVVVVVVIALVLLRLRLATVGRRGILHLLRWLLSLVVVLPAVLDLRRWARGLGMHRWELALNRLWRGSLAVAMAVARHELGERRRRWVHARKRHVGLGLGRWRQVRLLLVLLVLLQWKLWHLHLRFVSPLLLLPAMLLILLVVDGGHGLGLVLLMLLRRGHHSWSCSPGSQSASPCCLPPPFHESLALFLPHHVAAGHSSRWLATIRGAGATRGDEEGWLGDGS